MSKGTRVDDSVTEAACSEAAMDTSGGRGGPRRRRRVLGPAKRASTEPFQRCRMRSSTPNGEPRLAAVPKRLASRTPSKLKRLAHRPLAAASQLAPSPASRMLTVSAASSICASVNGVRPLSSSETSCM